MVHRLIFLLKQLLVWAQAVSLLLSELQLKSHLSEWLLTAGEYINEISSDEMNFISLSIYYTLQRCPQSGLRGGESQRKWLKMRCCPKVFQPLLCIIYKYNVCFVPKSSPRESRDLALWDVNIQKILAKCDLQNSFMQHIINLFATVSVDSRYYWLL